MRKGKLIITVVGQINYHHSQYGDFVKEQKMVAIKDFDMPRSCNQCTLYKLDAYNADLYCYITGANVDDMMEHRHKDCPLVEVKDGKID